MAEVTKEEADPKWVGNMILFLVTLEERYPEIYDEIRKEVMEEN